jgi:hypothetical protein
LDEKSVRKHLRTYLQKLDYDVWDQEEKEIIPGVKADLVASSRGKTKKVMAVETKGSNGNAKQAIGQAVTYLASDLIRASYVGLPEDLLKKSPYARDVCQAVGIGLFEVRESGEIVVEKHPKPKSPSLSASLWGNRRNGAPDTSKLSDLKLAVLAVADEAKSREDMIKHIQQHRLTPAREKWCQVFIDDATQMGLIIRRLDGTYVLSSLGRTLVCMNRNVEAEKRLLSALVFNFPVAYMILRILKERGSGISRKEILEKGIKLEREIPMDGIFQSEFRKKYHLNEQRLTATIGLMKDIGLLELDTDGLKLKSGNLAW